MVQLTEGFDPSHADLSIIPSYECNLRCSFCMYSCSPQNRNELATWMCEEFFESINDWSLVYNMGFYGGEPSINPAMYQKFIDLAPAEIPKFTITNGSWSVSRKKTDDFLSFCNANRLRVFVSSTSEHKSYQEASVIAFLKKTGRIQVKEPDTIHPMGRAARADWSCTKKCTWHRQPTRMALTPEGGVIFQNCNGVYPLLGGYHEGFTVLLDRAADIRRTGCSC